MFTSGAADFVVISATSASRASAVPRPTAAVHPQLEQPIGRLPQTVRDVIPRG